MRRRHFGTGLIVSLLLTSHGQAQEFEYGKYETLFAEPVSISATGKPERLSESPVLMDVISAEDINRSGAKDIPTLLRRLAGVDIKHSSQNAQDMGVGGYVQPLVSRVMVLINGRQVYFDGFGDVLWATLPVELEEIRQIEVIRGPQSALYGFNAVDGVINIVTFDPVDDPVNMVRSRIGNMARREVAGVTTQPLGEGAGIRLSIADDHAHDAGLIDKSASSTAYSKNPDRRMLSANGAFTLPDESRIGFEASHTDVGERLSADNLLFAGRVKTDTIKGSYTAETDVGRVNATAYYTDLNMPWVQTQAVGKIHIDDRVGSLQFSDLFKIGTDDSFRFGLEGRRNRLLAPGAVNGTLTSDLWAGSSMWEHSFLPSLTMVNAVRYDYFKLGRSGDLVARDIYTNADFDRADVGTSVTSSLVEAISADDKLHLTFSRGLKLPSLTNLGQMERFLSQTASVYSFGNPDLRAAAVYGYQAGWDHRISPLDADARVTFFHNMTTSHIGSALDVLNGHPVLISAMTPGSVTNGVTLGLSHKAHDGWTWGGNYTYQKLHEHSFQGLAEASPTHKLNANVGYGMGDWEADLYASYTSSTKGRALSSLAPVVLTEVPLKAYETLSPRLAWRPRETLTVELSAENLWSYRDTVSQRMGASYFLTLKVTY